jgi:hypothetical protein
MFRTYSIAAFAVVMAASVAARGASFGPSPYLQASDSPFAGIVFDGYFHLEDFEDHLLNTPGLAGSPGGVTSVIFGASSHDSVDADDGSVDGSGLSGDSYFFSSGASGVTFTFDSGVLGGLPTHAGLVWTDGGTSVTFQAFGPGNVLLGTIGPVSDAGFPDGSVSGTTAEDRFLGWSDAGGISSIFVSNASGGIEVDHVQYGLSEAVAVIPLPAAAWTALSCLAAMGSVSALRRRRRGAA